MRSDASGEKHTPGLKKSFITQDYHGALTLLLLALPAACCHKKPNFISLKKFFYGYFLYGVYYTLCWRG